MRDAASSTEALSKSTSHASNTLPATPSKTLNEPSSTPRHLNTRKSLRNLVRPSQPSSNDASVPKPPAMKSSPSVQPRKSTTSLFNLFSKPKVEKARGYGGEGPVPQPAAKPQPPPTTVPLKSALKMPQTPRPVSTIQNQTALRTASALSVRPHFDLPNEPLKDGSATAWAPPPLFQAFAKSTRHGLAEISTSTVAEKNTPGRPQSAWGKEGRTSPESENSEDTKKSRMSIKGAVNGLSLHSEPPQKIIVLLDSGHLLQYSQHGPTNRLPEKVLLLCPDSAVMACNVGPNKQHAMRVVQSVAQKSFSLAHTFSRLTRRSAVSKRDAGSLVVVFTEASEMNDWMQAIRSKISELCQPVVSTENTGQSKVDSVIGDATLPSSPPPAEKKIVLPTKIVQVPDRRASLAPQSPPPPRTSFDDLDDGTPDRKGSLEILEEEAEKLLSAQMAPVKDSSEDKRSSDAPSYDSSSTTTGDQHTLNNLRNSARMSYLSSGTGLTSRTSSLTSEPSSSQDTASEVHKSPYRGLSSYQTKRRSVLPSPAAQPASDVHSNTASLLGQVASAVESPVKTSPPPPPATILARSPNPPTSQVMTALPDLQASRKDATPPIAEEDERPQSILADLPPPSTWSTKLSPKSRHSLIGPPMTERQIQRMSSAPALQTVPTQQQSRRASQAFRLPLKINPDNSAYRTPSRTRSNRNTFSPDVASGEPKVFTLEAKVDPRSQRMSMGTPYSHAELKARSAQRLSLFPSPLLPQDSFSDENRRSLLNTTTQTGLETVPPRRASLQRPTSLQVRTDRAPFLSSIRNSTHGSPPNDKTAPLSTPTSAPPIRSLKPSRSSSAISSMQTVAEQGRPASPTDPFQSGRPLTLEHDNAISYRRQSYMSKRSPSPSFAPPVAPLPFTPGVPMGNSFAQRKTSQRHSYMPRTSNMTSLQALDFGIPAVGLGPPAPPPSAPLPAPPGGAPPGILSRGTTPIPAPASRRASTASYVAPSRSGSVSAQSTGLGIQVGS